MPTEECPLSQRLDEYSELTDSTGTTNAAIDATSAKIPVNALDTDADETNGRYFITDRDLVAATGSRFMALKFAGQGADNATFKAAVWGWSIGPGGLWCPNKLLELTGTLGTLTGLSGHDDFDNTWRFPDALSITENNCPASNAGTFGGVAAGNGCVDLWFDPAQYPVLEVELADNSSATAVRCWRAMQG